VLRVEFANSMLVLLSLVIIDLGQEVEPFKMTSMMDEIIWDMSQKH
jgi:hypothetical protein